MRCYSHSDPFSESTVVARSCHILVIMSRCLREQEGSIPFRAANIAPGPDGTAAAFEVAMTWFDSKRGSHVASDLRQRRELDASR